MGSFKGFTPAKFLIRIKSPYSSDIIISLQFKSFTLLSLIVTAYAAEKRFVPNRLLIC